MNDLSVIERRDFDSLQRQVEAGLATFLEVGEALRQIRDRKLYREQAKTFEEYAKNRFDLTRSRAYQFIEAADVKADLSKILDKNEMPKNESQFRALAQIPSDDLPEVWEKVQEHSKETEKPPTAKMIRDVAFSVVDAEKASENDSEPETPASKTQKAQDCGYFLNVCKQHAERIIMHSDDASGHRFSPQCERVQSLCSEILECLRRW